MLTINPSGSEIIYVITATNKRLLISESRDDLNRCTPCRGNPDQHATRFPRSVRVWSKTIHISRGQHLTTFYDTTTDLDRSHCSREKGSRHNPQHVGWSIRGFVPSFSPEPANEAGGHKSGSYRWPTTRLIGPISLACDRYVQYLFTGATHRSLTDIGGGYNLGGVGLPHTTPRPFPTNYLHFPTKGPARSPV
jgi:hypothetical protein